MALKWVRCRKTFSRKGVDNRKTTYHKGDWFQARNQEIRKRLAAGEIELATSVGKVRVYRVEECGVVTTDSSLTVEALGAHGIGLELTYSEDYTLRHLYTLFWDGGSLRTELLPISFELLKKWEIAIPISDFNILAESVGSEEDRALTKSVLGDLRVPLYNVRQIYARRCPEVKNLLRAWKSEQEKVPEGDSRLAFLRALYVNPLLILALPPSWIVGVHV